MLTEYSRSHKTPVDGIFNSMLPWSQNHSLLWHTTTNLSRSACVFGIHCGWCWNQPDLESFICDLHSLHDFDMPDWIPMGLYLCLLRMFSISFLTKTPHRSAWDVDMRVVKDNHSSASQSLAQLYFTCIRRFLWQSQDALAFILERNRS